MSGLFVLLQGKNRHLVDALLTRVLQIAEMRAEIPALHVLRGSVGKADSLTGAVGLIFLLLGLQSVEVAMAPVWEQLVPAVAPRGRLVAFTQRLVNDTMLCASQPPCLESFVDMIMLKAMSEGLYG